MGDSAVGLYAQASVLAERMSTLGHAVYSSSAARLGSDPPAAAAQLAAELVRVLLLVMVPVAIVLALLGKPIMVVLFGSEFGPAAEPFAILLPGAVCLTIWYVLSLYIMSSLHRPGTTTLIQGLGFLISAPLYWIAVGEVGPERRRDGLDAHLRRRLRGRAAHPRAVAAHLMARPRADDARRPPHGRARAARARRAAPRAPRALPLA